MLQKLGKAMGGTFDFAALANGGAGATVPEGEEEEEEEEAAEEETLHAAASAGAAGEHVLLKALHACAVAQLAHAS